MSTISLHQWMDWLTEALRQPGPCSGIRSLLLHWGKSTSIPFALYFQDTEHAHAFLRGLDEDLLRNAAPEHFLRGQPVQWETIEPLPVPPLAAISCIPLPSPTQTVSLWFHPSQTDPLLVEPLFSILRVLLETHTRLRKESGEDMLTGIANRRAFLRTLQRKSSLAARHKHVFCIALLDLDRFKEVNDRFGHTQGNHLLAAIGTTMRHVLRTTDTPARIGGDEFAILLPHTTLLQAEFAIHRLASSLASIQSPLPLSFCCGILEINTPSVPSAQVLETAADQLLYQAKAKGPGSVCSAAYTPA